MVYIGGVRPEIGFLASEILNKIHYCPGKTIMTQSVKQVGKFQFFPRSKNSYPFVL
jgi:hypothetical protein